MHLTEETYRRLLAGTLQPSRARFLAAHLERPCPACERFLARRAVADALDGRVDAALLSLAPPRAGAPPRRLERVVPS